MFWLLHWWQTNKRKQFRMMPHISIGWRLVTEEVVLLLHFLTVLQEFSQHMMNYQLHPVIQHCIQKTYQQQVVSTVFAPTEGGSK